MKTEYNKLYDGILRTAAYSQSVNCNQIKKQMTKEEIGITKESKELKEILSYYRTDIFLGDLSAMLINPQFLVQQGLKSPLREIMYIANLHLTSNPVKKEDEKPQYPQNEWDDIVKRIQRIQEWYIGNILPKDFHIEDETLEKRLVSGQSFFNYFSQGPLNYEEQVIERISSYFSPFDDFIIEKFGLTVEEMLSITDWITKIPNKFLASTMNPSKERQSYREFAMEMRDKGIIPPLWQKHMPDHLKKQFQFMYDKGKMNTFSRDEIIQNFGEEKAEAYIKNFVLSRNAEEFLYYTQQNNLEFRSIFLREDSDFQFIKRELLHFNIYNSLFQKLTENAKKREKFFKIRGRELEKKIIEIFKNHFGDSLEYYESYYTDKGSEQDLIFFYKKMALIVEVKASKVKEPRRDPLKAFDLIQSNFEEVIDKGYDQCFRVKEYFIDRENFNIYSDIKLKNCVKKVCPKSYPHCFSLVVSLERFGGIQCDLSQMLELYDDDNYPWSVNVDDLETFLLLLTKLKDKKKNITLEHFLYLRQRLHGRLIADDELDICGAFLTGKLNMKSFPKKGKKVMPPFHTKVFDEHYQGKGGLGFENERDMELKNSDNKYVLGK